MKFKSVFFSALALLFFSCSKTTEDTPAELLQSGENFTKKEDTAVVLTIADREFSNEDLKRFLKIQYPEISMPEAGNEQILARIFDNFVENQLILFQADKKEVSVVEEEIREYMSILNQDQLEGDIQIIEDLVRVQKHLFFYVYKDIKVNEKDIEQYYQENLDDFRKKEEIELKQILYREKKKALKAREKLVHEPRLFEEIARAESESPDAHKGGLMGFFERGLLPREMENVVFSLKLNEISPVVESPYGFHIFKVTGRKRERLLYMSVVRDEIYNKLLSEKLSYAHADYLNRLREEIAVTTYTDNLFFPYFK